MINNADIDMTKKINKIMKKKMFAEGLSEDFTAQKLKEGMGLSFYQLKKVSLWNSILLIYFLKLTGILINFPFPPEDEPEVIQ